MKKNLPLGILALTATTSALATTSPVLSISNTAVTGVNVGEYSASSPSLATYSGRSNLGTTSVVTSESLSKTIIEPTTTQTGLAYDYTRQTTTTTTRTATWNYDSISWGVGSDPTLFSGGKYLTLTGSFSSLVSGNVYIDLSAQGSYLQTSFSPFGAVSPALPALYFGTSLRELERLYSWTSDNAGQYGTNTSATLQVTAGVAQSFAAVVYAGDAVSLESFDLWARGPDYNYQVTDSISAPKTTEILTGSHLIPAVPEPETYGMLLAGLGIIGAVVRRRLAG